MSKYPLLSARKVLNALKRIGFEIVKQKGSHIKLSKRLKNRKITTIVPNHKTIMRGTLKGILELAETDLKDLMENL